jgi:SAM-dependent methyltransferase
MSKKGEINYLKKIGAAGIEHALNKPFSDEFCSRYFFELGAVFALLPHLPAKILDLGCGTGWTSVFFARRGYEVLGIDIAPDMIEQANKLKDLNHCNNAVFQAADYENIDYKQQFDAVVFFDALHHSVNEKKALKSAYKALKPGGVCITVEPGIGHGSSPEVQAIARKFDTTEKEMNPVIIKAIGEKTGFRFINIYPQPDYVKSVFYNPSDQKLTDPDYTRFKAEIIGCIDNRELHGVVVLKK